MPRIIMNRAFIARWTRMPDAIGRLSALASSHHSLSSAAFITNIAESDFRHAQAVRSRNMAATQNFLDRLRDAGHDPDEVFASSVGERRSTLASSRKVSWPR